MIYLTEEEAGHKHLLYVSEKTSVGVTSFNSGHSHEVIREAGVESPQMMQPKSPADAVPTGALAIKPWLDGHSHTISDFDFKANPVELEDEELVDETLLCFDEALRREQQCRATAVESENFFMNKQWEPAKVAENENQKKSSLTINKIADKIRRLSGYQRNNRSDLHYLPTENGDARTADALNVISKVILENCYYPREESKVTEDQMVVGRGAIHISEDYEMSLDGKLIVEKFPWDEVWFGPHEKEDLSDCDYIIKAKWFSESKMKEMFPDEFNDLSPEPKTSVTEQSASEDWDKRISSEELYDHTAKKYRVIEMWKKEYQRSWLFVSVDDNMVFEATKLSQAQQKWARTIPAVKLIPRVSYRFLVTRVSCETLLDSFYVEDEKYFPIIPVYAIFRRGVWTGIIENGKDLQRLINKSYSQFVDILAKVSAYGWFYDTETFPDARAREEWKNNSGTPGFNQLVNNVAKPPAKSEGVKFPQELVEALKLFNDDLREIIGVYGDMTGQDDRNAGLALKEKISQALLGSAYIFENLGFAKQLLGKILLLKIKKLYSPQKLLRILTNQNQKEPLQLGNQPFDAYTPEDIMALFQVPDFADYDVAISESPSSPSAMMTSYLMFMELASKGYQVPFEAILEYAPVPNKQKIREILQAQQQAQQQAEDKKYATEITKTAIAKGATNQAMPPGGSA